MKKTVYQIPELRDENDNIIQEGTYGKESPLVNSTNDGVLDYINNNLEALYDAQTAAGNAITTGGLTVSGKTTTGTLEASSATVSGQTTTGTLAAGDTTVTGSITTTGLTVSGTTTVPTANAGNSSKAIANTEFVAKSLAALVDSAPDQLNTLNELAKALGNDANFAATITAELAKKLNSAEAESTYATKTEARVLPGTVTAFSGTFKDGFPVDKNTGLVNREWHLCDGTNGTPDLRNRFIYGGNGTNNGVTGGEATHTLKEAELPNITGAIQFRLMQGVSNIVSLLNDNETDGGVFTFYRHQGSKWSGTISLSSQSATDKTDVIRLNFGGNQPHNNMPPYYVLAYIMRL